MSPRMSAHASVVDATTCVAPPATLSAVYVASGMPPDQEPPHAYQVPSVVRTRNAANVATTCVAPLCICGCLGGNNGNTNLNCTWGSSSIPQDVHSVRKELGLVGYLILIFLLLLQVCF